MCVCTCTVIFLNLTFLICEFCCNFPKNMKFIISDFVDKVTGFFIFIIQYEVVNFLKYLIKILDYFQKYLIILKIEEIMGFPYIIM